MSFLFFYITVLIFLLQTFSIYQVSPQGLALMHSCRRSSLTPQSISPMCPSGTTFQRGRCIYSSSPGDLKRFAKADCPPGYTMRALRCVQDCPVGYIASYESRQRICLQECPTDISVPCEGSTLSCATMMHYCGVAAKINC